MDAKAKKKKFFLDLLELNECTQQIQSSREISIDAKAKKKEFFSIYLTLENGHDIVYLQLEPP